MLMNSELYIAISSAFISSIVACEIGHRHKNVQRGLYARLAVLVFCGFAGALVSMVVLSAVSTYQVVVSVISGAVYGYLMANAKALERIR